MFAVAKTRLVHLLAVTSLVVHLVFGQTSKSDGQAADEQMDCAQLRMQRSQLFRQTFKRKVPVNYLNELLPLWVESTLPGKCAFHKNAMSQFNPSSQIDNRGPLSTLGPADSIFTTSLTTNWPTQRGFEAQMGGNRWAQTNQSGIDPMLEFARYMYYKGDAFADKRPGILTFLRPKRFVGGLGAGGMGPIFGGIGGAPADPRAPPREVTEAEQMMNTMLMFSNFQKIFHASELGRLRKGSQTLDKPSLSNGMYGDQYYGRRRRRKATPISRSKRFLFGGSEPGDPLPINPLFDIYGLMAGTAVDPNTGNRVEFGGDTMTNLVANTYMSILPMGNPPPSGHEPPEMFKNMANVWYLNTLQNVLSPRPQRTYPTNQIRRNGFYGDTFPGKRRKKRSVSASVAFSGEESDNGLLRSRRQAEEVKLENTPANTPQKPIAFYRNQVFYGDPLYATGQATGYDRAMSTFRRILLKNQKLRQQYEKQPERPYNYNGNYRNPERAQFTNTNLQQQVAPPLYVPASSHRMPPPAQDIPYQAHPTYRPAMDPFILLPAPKDSFDPFAQGLDPFIPNPTTTPPPTTTALTAEPGKRRKRSDESVSAGEDAHARLRRANKHTEFENPYPDFYYPYPFFNGFLTNGFFNPYQSRYFSNGGYDNLKPYKSSYLGNNGEVIYGDRPSWSSNGHSGNSRSKRSESGNHDFFYYGGFEGERGYKKEEKGKDKSYYGNGFDGQFFGAYFPWFFNGNSNYDGHSRSKRSDWRNHDYFYYRDHDYKKEENGKDKSYYGNGFDGQFFGGYFPWFFDGNSNYDGHSRSKRSDWRNHDYFYYRDHDYKKEENGKDKSYYGNGFDGQYFGGYFPWFFDGNSNYDGHSRSKRSDWRNHDYVYYRDHDYKKEENGKDKSYYGNGFDGQFFGEYFPWFFNGNSNYDGHSRSKRSDWRNHDYVYYRDHDYKKEENGKDKSYYGNGFDGQFFGEYFPWFFNGNSYYDGHYERSRSKRSEGSSLDFFNNGGNEGDHRGYLNDYRGHEKTSYSNGRGDRFYGDFFPNGKR